MIDIGVILPSVDVQRREGLDLATAARHAEDAGLDSVWHGDHLAVGGDVLDSTIALAAAATATTRVQVGTSVFVPALRPLAWAAKQVASLMWISGGRLVLGVGSGGGPEQWAAAGVPYAERGPRTDTALRLLPELLSGAEVALPDQPGQPPVRLGPATAVPPIWVGNASPVAIRRAARLGDGWFPSLIGPGPLAAGVARLRELRPPGRPDPAVSIGATGTFGIGTDRPSRRDLAEGISRAYGRPVDEVLDIPLVGAPAAVAEQLSRYAEAGAHHVVVGLGGAGWRAQCDVLAEVRTLLR
ncbi:MAG TPA: LLM class flavin-dependent oxidoreductase [Acidimicrobiales bacterium]|nr:LLM class flavin-dependent oxidoreductase [Acidimicrobiales bacterium]